MKKTGDDVVVKKVKAFPIAGQIKTAAGVAIPIQIVKLTRQGFLAELAPTPIQPGEKFEVSFRFPVYNAQLTEFVVMVKLYQHWGGQSATATTPVEKPPDESAPQHSSSPPPSTPSAAGIGIVHLVEMHFQPLSSSGAAHIDKFLAQVAQLQKRSS